MGILLITHYQRMLNYIKPDQVHVLVQAAASSAAAAASWRPSWKPRATTGLPTKSTRNVPETLAETHRRRQGE